MDAPPAYVVIDRTPPRYVVVNRCPPPAVAAPVLRSFVDAATGCTYTETAPGSGRYTRTSCPPR